MNNSSPVPGNIKSLRAVVRYLAPYRTQIAGAALALIFTSGAVLGLGLALRYLVDEGVGKGDVHLLNRGYEFLMGVILLWAFATYARYYLVSWIGERTIADLRNDIYRQLMRMDIAFYETTRTGEMLSRLTTDTTLLQTVIGGSVSQALRNMLMMIGGLTMLLITSAKLTGYVLLILPVVLIPILVLGKRVRGLSRATQDRVADLSALAEESLNAIRSVQALSLEQHEGARFSDRVQVALDTALRRIGNRAMLVAIVIALVLGAIVTVLWIGGKMVVEGNLSAGELSSFVFYSVVVAGTVGSISEIIGELQRAGGGVERIMQLLALRPAIAAPTHPQTIPAKLSGNVAFEQVTFFYPSRPEKPALADIALTVKAGETVALVGPSGAGKTTLFQLLLRFYDPSQGRITLDNIPIHEAAPEDLRRHIGLVPQDPFIFSADAWENIRYGNTQATQEEILKAAHDAAALEFLERLPQGLGTFLGEKGVRLSGGQRQRIAIARAIIRNPEILLLDEATSALDAENELLVQQALERVMQGRTTLVIAHRLATVLKADRIVVLDEGRIQAIGSHQELLQTSPLYARLARLQFGE